MRSAIYYYRHTLSSLTPLTTDCLLPATSAGGVSWFKVFTLRVLEEQRNFLSGSREVSIMVRFVSSMSVGKGSAMEGVASPQKEGDCEPILSKNQVSIIMKQNKHR